MEDLKKGMVLLEELDGVTPEELEFLKRCGISLGRLEEDDMLVIFKEV